MTAWTASAVLASSLEEELAEAPPILRVEEDWELAIETPDPNADCPQIVTVFGPTNANFGTHTLFELNHGTLPRFQQGGMQIQVWWADWLVGYKSQFAPTELSTASEVIRYTTVTNLNPHNNDNSDTASNSYQNTLDLKIINGQSETWGTFGDTSDLSIRLYTNRDDLNPYDPYNSIRHSRVTFGANRVNRFVRTQIRFYDKDGLFLTNSDDIYVHRLAIDNSSSGSAD